MKPIKPVAKIDANTIEPRSQSLRRPGHAAGAPGFISGVLPMAVPSRRSFDEHNPNHGALS
jgi:hypothetical protein